MPWAKGQSGNPKGRQSRARNRLTDRFIKELDADFRKNGAEAIQKCRETDPAQYIAVVSRLLPKDIQHNHLHELSSSFAAAIRAAQHTSPSVTVINGSAEHVDDEANALIPLNTQRSED